MSNESTEDFASLDDLDKDLEDAQNDAAAQSEADNAIPEQYQNKTLEQLIAENQAAQEMISRQAAEVGEMRKLADQLVQKHVLNDAPAQASNPESAEDPDTQFLLNPRKAVEEAVSNHPMVKEAAAKLGTLSQREAHQALIAKHPDAPQVTATQEFKQWVGSNPALAAMYEQAANQFDVQAGVGLLDLYKQTNPTPAAIDSKKSDPQAASTPTGSGGSSPSSKTAGKVFRRSDIRKLMANDPAKYKKLMPQIMAAYAEGRGRE